jgi:transcription elongation factor Elf1
MSNFLNQLPLDGLKIISFCPICNEHHKLIEAKILEEKDRNHLIYLKCKKCNSSIVSLVTSDGMGINSIGLVTDLTAEDVLKFKNYPAISSDDVILIHQFLEEKQILKN